MFNGFKDDPARPPVPGEMSAPEKEAIEQAWADASMVPSSGGCPSCRAVGFTPAVGKTALGEPFQGCSFCVAEAAAQFDSDMSGPLCSSLASTPGDVVPVANPDSIAASNGVPL